MFINLWVTTNCNFSCKYCYEGQDKPSLFLSESTVNNLIEYIKNEISEKEEIVIEFHGGEPLLNFHIIEYTVNKVDIAFPLNKKSFGITTNAYCLNEKIADFLSERMNFNLSISIDGAQDTNDKYRVTREGKGTFNIVERNAHLLLRKRSDVMARMTVMPDTVNDLYNNCMKLVNIGFKVVGSSIDFYDKRWTEEHFEILYGQLVKLWEIQNQYKNIRFPMTNFYCKKMSICGFGKKYFNLYPNGDIYPCIFCAGDLEFVIGNINMEGFNMEKIHKYYETNKKENIDCNGCNHIQNCVSSRCKFMNYALMGNYLSPSPVVCAMENVKQRLSCLGD